MQAEIAVDAASAQDRRRPKAAARAGVEGDLDHGVDGGDVVVQRLEDEVGQAVAVDVDEALLRPALFCVDEMPPPNE